MHDAEPGQIIPALHINQTISLDSTEPGVSWGISAESPPSQIPSPAYVTPGSMLIYAHSIAQSGQSSLDAHPTHSLREAVLLILV